ncbi:putative sulfate exporter family transporter [Campylobacter sp.]|uniref:YeiH family protein n=1 Tax=Campylobacter sp. TaxID=205 RepID=UPI0026DB3743|nr:putative sulfate exporter family transporter [Campylobacter sp.]MDO4674217.1 putative sulfate exporter family transporter [Campylobacter sp.]
MKFLSPVCSISKGLVFTALIGFLAIFLAEGLKASTQIGSSAFAIVLGMCFAPLFFKHEKILKPGVHFGAKKILRLGIILYGFNVSVNELLSVGIWGFALASIVIVCVFGAALFLGVKFFRLDKESAMLVGAGSAICGAAAVLALESCLKSEPMKGILAVGSVVIFGLILMFLYPLLFSFDLLRDLDENALGIFMGATLHEVANVVGASSMVSGFSQSGANLALIIKMMRVILLVPFLLLVPLLLADKQPGKKLTIPYFAFAFLACIFLHSFVAQKEEFCGLESARLIAFLRELCLYCLVIAMTALGLQLNLKQFMQGGVRVLGLALSLALILVFGGYFLTLAFGGILH